jgi:hypothetical protein
MEDVGTSLLTSLEQMQPCLHLLSMRYLPSWNHGLLDAHNSYCFMMDNLNVHCHPNIINAILAAGY